MPQKKESADAMQNALRVRARAKSKKPKFVRSESWKYDKFSLSWRRPRGLDNKIRRKIKGWPPGPSSGYKGPKMARGLHPSGYEDVVVHNVAELANIDPITQVARIAHTVGKRKRDQIIAEAKTLNLKIVNARRKEPAKEETKGEEEEKKTEAESKPAEKKEEKEEEEQKPKTSEKKTERDAEKQ